MEVSPSTRRSHITRESEQVTIHIPAEKNIFLVLLFLPWLCGWFLVEIFGITGVVGVVSSKIQGNYLFFLVWLCGWTFAGVVSAFTVLWTLGGKERIIVTPRILRIERRLFGFGVHREYSLANARNFRVSGMLRPLSLFYGKRFLKGYYMEGPLAFDYGMKTIQFGLAIDAAEAGYILRELTKQGFIQAYIPPDIAMGSMKQRHDSFQAVRTSLSYLTQGNYRKLLPSKLFGAYLLVLVLIVGSANYYMKDFKSPSTIKEQELTTEFNLIQPLPGAVRHSNLYIINKIDHISVSAYYNSTTSYDEIRTFYIREAARNGWRFSEEGVVKDWGKDLGGKTIKFTKGERTLSIQYAGNADAKADYGWDFAVSIGWKECGDKTGMGSTVSYFKDGVLQRKMAGTWQSGKLVPDTATVMTRSWRAKSGL